MARARRLIHTTPDAAFTYLSDLTRHGEWAGNRRPGQSCRRRRAPSCPEQPSGAAALSSASRMEDELKVIDFQPPLRFAFESTGRGGVYRHVIEFEAADGGTLVTKEMRTIEGPAPMRIFKPISEFYLGRRMAADLKRIARRLEARKFLVGQRQWARAVAEISMTQPSWSAGEGNGT